jgi:ABC-2 type transport system permease protein
MVLVGNLGQLLDLPGWLVGLSPLSHLAAVPAEDVAALPAAVLIALAAAGTVIGLVGMQRRQVGLK